MSEAPTRLALLGTLGDLHTQSLRFDLACLRSLVEALEPDLLGVEIEPAVWETGDLSDVSVETREALIPAAWRTNTVIVPLGGPSLSELAPLAGGNVAPVRESLVRAADRLLTGLQRTVDGPEGVNSALFGHVCGVVCDLQAALGGEVVRRAWQSTNARILERLLWAVRRDPGRRVLVAVQCRRVHWLESHLRPLHEEVTQVPYACL